MANGTMHGVVRQLRRAALVGDDRRLTDGQLLERFLERRDESAFEAIVRRHGPMVLGVAGRLLRDAHDAEDVFQATFLVFFRKAASIRPRDRVGNWLYGVAYRTALKARTARARRAKHENHLREVSPSPSAEDAAWADLRPILDRELARLPDGYRAPVVLCDLEGQTKRSAARRLGIPEGTLSSRLARGRALLRTRLVRRGVTLSVGSLAALLSREAAAAGVPSSLVSLTVRATRVFTAGHAATGVISAQIAALMEGVLKAMMLNKLKTAAVWTLLVVLLGGAAGAVYRTQAAEDPKAAPPSRTAMAEPTPAPVLPPRRAQLREYTVTTRLLETGTDQLTKAISLPRLTIEEGQHGCVQIDEGPQNLLAKTVSDEGIKIGTYFDVRVRPVDQNKVRLTVSFQRNEVEKSDVREILVLGNIVQAVRDIEIHKAEKVVLQKDGNGTARRWVEVTVERPEWQSGDERIVPPPATPLPTSRTKSDRPRPLEQIGTDQAKKDYQIAEFYRQRGRLAAAYFYYEMVARRYPQTDFAAKALREMGALEIHHKAEIDRQPGRVGRLTIVGNSKTPDGVILEKIPLYPGQVFRAEDLKTAERNLEQLGRFRSRPTVDVVD